MVRDTGERGIMSLAQVDYRGAFRDQVFPGFLQHLRDMLDDPATRARLHPLIRLAMRHAGDPFDASDSIVVTAVKPV
jgi:hypothetical protein